MVTVQVIDNNLEKALRKFRKEVDKEGIMQTIKDKQYFVKPSAKKHEKNKYRAHCQKLAKKYAKKDDEEETK